MRRRAFSWRHTPGLRTFTYSTFLFLYAPLAILVAYSFNASRAVTIWGGFSLRWFGQVIRNPDILAAAGHSVQIALAAMVLSTLIAIGAALGLVRGAAGRSRLAVLGLVMLPLVVPEIVVAITTLVLFSALGFKFGLLNLIIAHTVFCIPFATLPIMARLRQLGPDVENAARDLYGDEWAVFRLVTLPLMMPAVVSGAMLAFVSSLDDFLISQLVADAGQTTLPVYVYGMMRLGVTPEVNAVSTLLLAISLVFVAASFLLIRGGRQSART